MHSTQHLYKLIYSRLKKQILTGQLEYGSLLPSISQLARLHQVSSKTIQSALKLLQKEGLICTRKRQRAMITYQAGFLQEKDVYKRQSSLFPRNIKHNLCSHPFMAANSQAALTPIL